jgi:hypothetical protein
MISRDVGEIQTLDSLGLLVLYVPLQPDMHMFSEEMVSQ